MCLLYEWKGTLKHMSLVGSTASPETRGTPDGPFPIESVKCHESNDEICMIYIYTYIYVIIILSSCVFVADLFCCQLTRRFPPHLDFWPCVVETSHNWQVNITPHLRVWSQWTRRRQLWNDTLLLGDWLRSFWVWDCLSIALTHLTFQVNQTWFFLKESNCTKVKGNYNMFSRSWTQRMCDVFWCFLCFVFY